jgi:hypothetical protein
MPTSSIGKRAQCRACGATFIVPASSPDVEDAPIPLEPSPAWTQPKKKAKTSEDEPGEWLQEFDRLELDEGTSGPSTRPQPSTSRADPNAPKPSERPDDILAPPVERPSGRHIRAIGAPIDDPHGWVAAPEKPFWHDVVDSFVFFMDADNVLTFMLISFVHAAAIGVATAGFFIRVPVTLGFIWVLGLMLGIVVWGYLSAFYLAVVRESASGEDVLPSLWFSDLITELFGAMILFIMSWLLVLLPAIAVGAWAATAQTPVSYMLTGLAAAAGIFLWPAVILGAAIGGGLGGLWPHTVIRTVTSAPHAYLAIYAVILVAAGITWLPHTATYAKAMEQLSSRPGLNVSALVLMVNSVLSAYATIVAMRTIGLFYRHYKERFPWAAE